jgi:hypothetical protein
LVSSDRYKAYLSITREPRKVSCAHLKRNLLAFADRVGPNGGWGTDVEVVFAATKPSWDEGTTMRIDSLKTKWRGEILNLASADLLQTHGGQAVPDSS